MSHEILSGISALSNEKRRRLLHGRLSASPEWYAVFEGSIPGPSHILRKDNSGSPKKLIPLFHLKEPPSFITHDPFKVINGAMFDIGGHAEGVSGISPVTMSTPPFSYRYGCSAVDKGGLCLTDQDIGIVEEEAIKNGSRLSVFLYVDAPPYLDALEKAGYLLIPCAIRWEFDPSGLASFEDWLLTIPRKRRKEVRREIRRATEEGIEIKRWNKEETSLHRDEIYSIYKEHMEKYGFEGKASEGIREYFPQLVENFGDKLTTFASYTRGALTGFTICIDSNDACYVKIGAYKRVKNRAYFIASYYRTIEHAIANQRLLDFSIGSDQVKRSRGLLPRVLYACVKPLNDNKELRARFSRIKEVNTIKCRGILQKGEC